MAATENCGIAAVSTSAAPHADLSASPLWNEDLAPTTAAQRTWSTWNIAALWIGMSVVITTYTLAGGFIEAGMNWWQAMMTILLGNTIVLIPMVLNAHAGTRYGISFPDLPGCTAMGKTMDETWNSAVEVLADWVNEMGGSEAVPMPRPLEAIRHDAEVCEAIAEGASLITVPPPRPVVRATKYCRWY